MAIQKKEGLSIAVSSFDVMRRVRTIVESWDCEGRSSGGDPLLTMSVGDGVFWQTVETSGLRV